LRVRGLLEQRVPGREPLVLAEDSHPLRKAPQPAPAPDRPDLPDDRELVHAALDLVPRLFTTSQIPEMAAQLTVQVALVCAGPGLGRPPRTKGVERPFPCPPPDLPEADHAVTVGPPHEVSALAELQPPPRRFLVLLRVGIEHEARSALVHH